MLNDSYFYNLFSVAFVNYIMNTRVNNEYLSGTITNKRFRALNGLINIKLCVNKIKSLSKKGKDSTE